MSDDGRTPSKRQLNNRISDLESRIDDLENLEESYNTLKTDYDELVEKFELFVTFIDEQPADTSFSKWKEDKEEEQKNRLAEYEKERREKIKNNVLLFKETELAKIKTYTKQTLAEKVGSYVGDVRYIKKQKLVDMYIDKLTKIEESGQYPYKF